MRARQARLLVRPSVRSAAWLGLLPAGALGLAVLSLDGPVLLKLRLAAVALCVGAAFVLDDAAAETTASAATPLVFRRLVRIALVLPLIAGLWALLLAYAGTGFDGALTLELAAMLAVVLAAAALAAPLLPEGRGGLAAAPTLLVLVALAAVALPDTWTLFASGPEDARWAGSHERWAVVLVAGVAGFLLASRDPGRRRLLGRRTSRGREPIRQLDPTDPA